MDLRDRSSHTDSGALWSPVGFAQLFVLRTGEFFVPFSHEEFDHPTSLVEVGLVLIQRYGSGRQEFSHRFRSIVVTSWVGQRFVLLTKEFFCPPSCCKEFIYLIYSAPAEGAGNSGAPRGMVPKPPETQNLGKLDHPDPAGPPLRTTWWRCPSQKACKEGG